MVDVDQPALWRSQGPRDVVVHAAVRTDDARWVELIDEVDEECASVRSRWNVNGEDLANRLDSLPPLTGLVPAVRRDDGDASPGSRDRLCHIDRHQLRA